MTMATAADILGLNGKPKAKVPARWAAAYRELCAERDRLMECDRSNPETSRVKLDDLTDAASEESQLSVSLVTTSAVQATISEVMDAIRRIENGTYGICEVTGKPIEEKRLQAIPWARYSLEGQQELERAGAGWKSTLQNAETFSESEETSEEEGEEESDAA